MTDPTPNATSTEIASTISATWHISTFSDSGGASCVEAGPLIDGTERVAVRHSHHPDGPAIIYTRQEWEAFLAGARTGEFDFFA